MIIELPGRDPVLNKWTLGEVASEWSDTGDRSETPTLPGFPLYTNVFNVIFLFKKLHKLHIHLEIYEDRNLFFKWKCKKSFFWYYVSNCSSWKNTSSLKFLGNMQIFSCWNILLLTIFLKAQTKYKETNLCRAKKIFKAGRVLATTVQKVNLKMLCDFCFNLYQLMASKIKRLFYE